MDEDAIRTLANVAYILVLLWLIVNVVALNDMVASCRTTETKSVLMMEDEIVYQTEHGLTVHTGLCVCNSEVN